MLATLILLATMGCQHRSPEPVPPPELTEDIARPSDDGETSAAAAPVSEDDTTGPDGWPRSVDEAVLELLTVLDGPSMTTLLGTERDDLIMYHFGWGTGIRNEYGLWAGNQALMDDCGVAHPDDCSMVIIEATWARAQELHAQGLLAPEPPRQIPTKR
jgi:hypothetical protein